MNKFPKTIGSIFIVYSVVGLTGTVALLFAVDTFHWQDLILAFFHMLYLTSLMILGCLILQRRSLAVAVVFFCMFVYISESLLQLLLMTPSFLTVTGRSITLLEILILSVVVIYVVSLRKNQYFL